ncbi:hypothetical protein BDY21DRAFT_275419, partial [Lineolata rhizophorae]
RLLPGLEESEGALYEIGVADDGTFVGLAQDEMDESLTNLRAMAASLGCVVEVTRMVPVGECECAERAVSTTGLSHAANNGGRLAGDTCTTAGCERAAGAVDQLRVSLTGATMSGKTSLLGSLSTATLDNGRGKSRLSLLKHRHEIASGMTSSVTQELIGYQTRNGPHSSRYTTASRAATTVVSVVNYASPHVSSWTDIHAAVQCEDRAQSQAQDSRLVLLSDSAGHPRFRRTTVRGLVGWAPHWTLLCVSADEAGGGPREMGHGGGSAGAASGSPGSSGVASGGVSLADVHLSRAHLELCLDLELPLVVAITKLDLASKSGLRATLSSLLSALKAAGRKPVILPDTKHAGAAGAPPLTEADLLEVSGRDLADAGKVVRELAANPLGTVPIVLTSAVEGSGMGKLHALLKELPVPAAPGVPPAVVGDDTHEDEDGSPPVPLFHVEEVYSAHAVSSAQQPTILAGHVRYGSISVGDTLLLGPFPAADSSLYAAGGISTGKRDASEMQAQVHDALPDRFPVPTSREFPGALIRNLRLPVTALRADQVGTLGVVPVPVPLHGTTAVAAGDGEALAKVRKGMVLSGNNAAGKPPRGRRAFVARFEAPETGAGGAGPRGAGGGGGVRSMTVGSGVVVYVASVRASAKVVALAAELREAMAPVEDDDDTLGFGFEAEEAAGSESGSFEDDGEADGQPDSGATLASFQFLAAREFVEVGARVLVLPGGGPGLYVGSERGEKGVAGLEGFVGKVVEG